MPAPRSRLMWPVLLWLAAAAPLPSQPGRTEIRVGKAPHFLQVLPGGSRAVVTNHHSADLSVIDLTTNRQTGRVPAGHGPLATALSVENDRLFVSNMTTGLVKVLELPGLTEVETLKVGGMPTDLATTPDGYYLVVANHGTGRQGRLDIYDLQRNRLAGSVNVGVRPLAVAVRGTTAYVANTAEGTVSVVDLDKRQVTDTLSVGDGPNGLAVSRNGRRLLVTHGRSDDLWAIDLRRRDVLQRVPLPAGPFGLAVSEDERLLAVACYRAHSVAVLDADLSAGRPPQVIKVRRNPVGVAFTPDARRLLVGCERDDRVVVVPVPAPATR